jgi:hypothetical protein
MPCAGATLGHRQPRIPRRGPGGRPGRERALGGNGRTVPAGAEAVNRLFGQGLRRGTGRAFWISRVVDESLARSSLTRTTRPPQPRTSRPPTISPAA